MALTPRWYSLVYSTRHTRDLREKERVSSASPCVSRARKFILASSSFTSSSRQKEGKGEIVASKMYRVTGARARIRGFSREKRIPPELFYHKTACRWCQLHIPQEVACRRRCIRNTIVREYLNGIGGIGETDRYLSRVQSAQEDEYDAWCLSQVKISLSLLSWAHFATCLSIARNFGLSFSLSRARSITRGDYRDFVSRLICTS